MPRSFVLYDSALPNADGTRVLLAGLSLERFRKNPVMLYMHHRGVLSPAGSEVIGRWENIRIAGTQLLADAVFDEKDEWASKIARKVEEGFLKAASIGIDVTSVSTAARDKLPGQTASTMTKSMLLEASIVDIPANEDTLAMNYVQLSYTAAPTDHTNQITNQNLEEMEELEKLKGLRKAVGKALSLKQVDEDAAAEAIEALKTQASAAEDAEKQAALSLKAEYAAQDERSIKDALERQVISADEQGQFEKLFVADRALAQEMLAGRMKQAGDEQAQADDRKKEIAGVVNARQKDTQKTSLADLPEKEVRKLHASVDKKPYAAYLQAFADQDTGLISPN